MDQEPLLPDYGGACISRIVPTLLDPPDVAPAWFPEHVLDADRVVLLLIDGLGWQQLRDRAALAPTLTAMSGGPITSVAPSTTSTALTSITTGTPPGEHGVVGYRVDVDGEVLNVLRWSVASRDARASIIPEKLQLTAPFGGQRPPVVTRAEFRRSGFTRAHLDGCRFNGYRVTSSLVTEIVSLARAGEPLVYAYYDGVDKVSHEYGFGAHFDAEVGFVDRLVGELVGALPAGVALLVTADHGQVHVGDSVISLGPDVTSLVSLQSGEGRFRWLHARPGRSDDLLAASKAHHGDTAWVVSRDEAIDGGWFGPSVSDAARSRLGDVALVARADVAFLDADDSGPYDLVGRHGSLTRAEMLVPLLGTVT